MSSLILQPPLCNTILSQAINGSILGFGTGSIAGATGREKFYQLIKLIIQNHDYQWNPLNYIERLALWPEPLSLIKISANQRVFYFYFIHTPA